MNNRVLFVDDDPNILRAIYRQLRKKFEVVTALSGKEALDIIKSSPAFAVIVADMTMPEMNGAQLLSKVKAISPDTVRIMLTGNADQQTAIKAVNEGSIFRFLNKPCPNSLLENTLISAIEHYSLIIAEREILEKTVNGSIKVITEILSQVSPTSFSRSYRIKQYVSQIINALKLPNRWEFYVAASLSQIGCVTLPNDLIEKVYSGVKLDAEEEEMFESHPEVGANLLKNIPRFERIAEMIRLQHKKFFEYEGKPETIDEGIIRLGAQILKAVIDFDQLVFLGKTPNKAYEELVSRKEEYNPNILKLLENLKTACSNCKVKSIKVSQLNIGMILRKDVIAKNGLLIASKGQEVTFSVKTRLLNFAKTIGIEEPIDVIIRG